MEALQVIYFNRRLDHPVDRVWAALTDPAVLLGWWGEVKTNLSEGGWFTVRWLNTDAGGNGAVMTATISELKEQHVLEMVGDIHGVLRFELDPRESGTELHFSSTLDLPDEYRTVSLAGWHFHLDALADTLAGRTVDLVNLPDARWEGIHRRYAG